MKVRAMTPAELTRMSRSLKRKARGMSVDRFKGNALMLCYKSGLREAALLCARRAAELKRKGRE